jgi:hypothetical protein
VKVKSIWVMARLVAGLGSGSTILACKKEAAKAPEVLAAEKAAADKAIADKAVADMVAADKAAADKAIADKAVADKAAADRAVADKAVADKAVAEKVAADKAVADKAAADKAAADKAAADQAAADKAAALAIAEEAALPPDLVLAKAETTRLMAQVDLTMAKLDKLVATTGDLEEPSKSALAAIDALDAEAQAVKKRGDQMRDRGAAYFEAWEKQLGAMSTPEVAEIATQRKDELAAKYAEVLTAMQETRAAMDAYWGDMQKIHTALEEGLTSETHNLLGPQVLTAKEKATTLKSRVEATLTKLGQVSLIYTTR